MRVCACVRAALALPGGDGVCVLLNRITNTLLSVSGREVDSQLQDHVCYAPSKAASLI